MKSLINEMSCIDNKMERNKVGIKSYDYYTKKY